MGISETLADENYSRYQAWSRPFDEDNARAALLAFKGDVYTDFDLNSYGKRDFSFAQKHLRILSGLYGVLRPLDLMQPYRLEMGTKLKTNRGTNLYEFWGPLISENLQGALQNSGSNTLVNLASKEYFSSIRKDVLDAEIVTPEFKDRKGDSYRIISFWAKRARGAMCEFMIRNRIVDPEGLKDFAGNGYRFNKRLSKGSNWIFTRDKVPNA